MKPHSIRRHGLVAALALAISDGGTARPRAEEPSASFERDIRPLIETHCLDCHSADIQKGELDLEQFSTLAGVKRQPAIWQKVLDQLKNGEMPPEKKPQPSPEKKQRLIGWVRETLDAIALEHAGDPGRVVLRRLSNAEYTYTIRDLTHVESLDPAREFPADGAAGEGFTNTGQALPMSPSLVAKYLDAGKAIAAHAVLLPDGIAFSSKTTERDWTDERLERIRDFYGNFTDSDGKVDLGSYVAASLELRDSDQPVDAVARKRGLNANYLETILKTLEDRNVSPPLDTLRARWRSARPGDGESLAAEIARWQEALWTFGSVGHIGVSGADAWMNPVPPIQDRHEWKFKIAKPESGNECVLYLVAGDAGDGPTDDFVVWHKPHLVIPGRPPIRLRDVGQYVDELNAFRRQFFRSTTRFLAAAADAESSEDGFDVASLAQRHGVDTHDLAAWLDYLGTGSGGALELDLFTSKISGAGNPHADRSGNEAVWHFYTETVATHPAGPAIPPGSLLARWLAETDPDEKTTLAEALQELMASGPSSSDGQPDSILHDQLFSLTGPLPARATPRPAATNGPSTPSTEPFWGLDPARFGRHPNGDPVDAESLCVQAPSVIEIRLPADLFGDSELVTTSALDEATGAEGSVQVQILSSPPPQPPPLVPSSFNARRGSLWSSHDRAYSFSAPLIANSGSAARARFDAAFDAFRRAFPAAFCYPQIVPVDEVVTLTLYHREDDHLARLMLNDAERTELDRIWDELRYVSREAFKRVDALEQIYQFATQDADPKVFEPLREPFKQRAAAFQRRLVETEPRHLEAVLEFADRAFRRPLRDAEKTALRDLYFHLRDQELPHDKAIRLTLARVLLSPAFLYRAETPGAGAEPAPVNDLELAVRLGYFLWSSAPDRELRAIAESGELSDPERLIAQTRRMLADDRVSRLATEFACQWLHIYDFDQLDEKSERHFPTFRDLRDSMHRETVLFFTDLFQGNGSVLEILDADHTFLNGALAAHYGIAGVSGPEWRRVDGMKKVSRGGILGQSTILAKQSGASRTSPILRGNWIAEALLGDRLPKPPKDVPPLPKEEDTRSLSMREVTERHTADPSCSKCHARIDPLGFALENFDAIGRWRNMDPGNHPIDTRTTLVDGVELRGLDGLRNYLLTTRRDDFVRQFCRKLLGYSLGRAVRLSDEPLLREIQNELAANDYRVGTAIEMIVLSRQFREIRGRDATGDE